MMICVAPPPAVQQALGKDSRVFVQPVLVSTHCLPALMEHTCGVGLLTAKLACCNRLLVLRAQ